MECDEALEMPVHHRRQFNSAPPVLPGSLANPMYKLKSLLYPPKLSHSNYPLSSVLSCSFCMCDLHFWTNLYLRRTLNLPSPLIVGLSAGDIVIKPNTPSSATPSPAESILEGRFLYPQSSSLYKPKYFAIGRDPTRELKVVELLLAAVSSSTRYRRHSPGMSTSAPSQQMSRNTPPRVKGGSVGSTSAMGRQQYQFDAKRTFLK